MEFRILGPVEVVDDGRVVELGAAKERALLAVLLLNGNRVVSKEQLAEALWGDRVPGTATKALQVYVSHLRKTLGRERIATKAPGYELRLEDGELDLARFEQLVAEGRAEEALRLWRGPALADFAYEPFAQSEIARLDELRLGCLENRIEADLKEGRHASVVGELEALVLEHPLRERLRAQLMLALYRSGRQAEALETYQHGRRLLADELGLEPGPSLRELERAILRQEISLDLVSATADQDEAPEPARGVFVGRQEELDSLRARLDEASAGHGGLTLLVGEPGIGKSRLAEELVRYARGRGVDVLVGRCWEAGGAPAYWPWVQSLRSYLGEHETRTVREDLGTGAPEIAQVLPELRERLPDLPQPSREVEGARIRLFDALARFLRSASARRPLLVVLDDLHAADEPSLLLLRFVARELGDSRILLLGTYRSVDPTVRDPLAATLAELAREPVTRRIELQGLTVLDIGRYIEASVGTSLRDELVATVYAETEGNPLFVEEVVRLLSSEERFWELDATALRTLGVPQGVREVIGRRVGRLSLECSDVLTLATILGREFDLDALERLVELPSDRLLDVLDEAVTARVLTSVPGARGRLRFAHALIRETLYDQLTTLRKAQLHRRAGEALEALYADDPEPNLAELAFHFFESAAGGDAEKALDYARRAGARALELLAYEEAARLYELALEALEVRRPIDAAERCDLLLALGDALGKAGKEAEAKEALLLAASLARNAALPDHLGRAALLYGGRFPWLRAGTDDRLVPLLEEALAGLGGQESSLRVRLMARLAGALRDQPTLEPRTSLSREAVAIARRLGDPSTLGYALVSLNTATWGPNVERLFDSMEEVRRIAEETGDAELSFQAGWIQHTVWMSVGDTARVAEVAETHSAVAIQLKQPSQQWYSAVMRMWVSLFRGDFAEARRLADEAFELGRHAQSWDAGFSYRIFLFALRREQGRLREVQDLVASSIEEYRGYRSFRCLVPLIECELGLEDEARVHFDELAAADFSWLPRDGEWLFNLSVLAEVAAHLDDRPRAEILRLLLLPYAAMNAQLTAELAIGSVSRYLGILATTTGRVDEAVRFFEDAVETNRRMGARPWVAHTQHDYAQLLLARDERDDTERAALLLDEAGATAKELGMVALERKLAKD